MHILVVDDDQTNRLVLKAMLSKEGHEVSLAEGGRAAVEQFHERRPDMILMDVIMPDMDGYEATRRIKAACSDTFIPVIFITAATDDDSLSQCIECGGDDFIGKPFNRVVLRAKVRALERIQSLYATVHKQKQELAQHQARILSEHELTQRIFEHILEADVQPMNGVSRLRRPAERFSGDVVLWARTPSGALNILLGDVTGHGLAAAICAMPVAEIFNDMSAKGYSLAQIVLALNKRLLSLLPTGMFFAAALLQLDSHCESLHVWNGGVPDILIRHTHNGELHALVSGHLPLGVVGEAQLGISVEHVGVQPGDEILLHTDGLVEATNQTGEPFGVERVQALLRKGEQDLVSRLHAELQTFCQGTVIQDDVTLLHVRCEPELLKEHRTAAAASVTPGSAWQASLVLDADTLRSTDPLPLIMQLLSGLHEAAPYRAELFTVLSELFNNALDHGLLELDSKLKQTPMGFAAYYQERERRLQQLQSGSIRIECEQIPETQGGRIRVVVEDSGGGFAIQEIQARSSDSHTPSGRGIALVRALCTRLDYNPSGNRAVAEYQWQG